MAWRKYLALAVAALLLAAVVAFGPGLWTAWRFAKTLDQEKTAILTPGAEGLTKTCNLCHGDKGSAVNAQYPNLAGQPPGYVEAQLNALAVGARRAPQMQPLALSLSPSDRRAIDLYYAAQPLRRSSPHDASGKIVAPPLAETCSTCHGRGWSGAKVSAADGRTIVTPRLAGQGKAYMAAQLKAYRTGARKDPTGSMNAMAAGLSDQDIDALSRLLSSS